MKLEHIGVARGCGGCRCTSGARKNRGMAEFMGLSCKYSPERARAHPLRSGVTFLLGGGWFGV